MAEYIETQTQDGTTLRIEVEPAAKGTAGFSHHTLSLDVSNETAKDVYSKILNTIQACAKGVITTIQDLDTPPSAASVDFAIKIDAEVGAMIAKSLGDAHFKISLNWKQVEPEAEDKKK